MLDDASLAVGEKSVDFSRAEVAEKLLLPERGQAGKNDGFRRGLFARFDFPVDELLHPRVNGDVHDSSTPS